MSRPASSAVRLYRLYRFYDSDGALLYIGQTGREPLKRLLEHVGDKSWAPDMARWVVDPAVFGSEGEVLAAERAAIRAERPLHNVAHNGWGPHRASSRSGTRRGPVLLSRRSLPVAPRRAGSMWAWRAAVVVAAWLVLAGAGWWAAAHPLAAHVAADGRPRFGAVAATVVVGWPLAVWVSRGVRRWWRGLWRVSRRRR